MHGLHAWIERYFPCSFERGGPLLVILGVVSTLLYLFTNIWYRGEFRNLVENMMALTFFISAWGQRRQLKSDLIFRLMILAVLIPLSLYSVNLLFDYESADKYRSLNDLLKLYFFLPLAWWIGGSWEGARRMLIIAFLGLLIAILLDPNIMRSLNSLWLGRRVDFDIHNAQHGALLFGLVVLYCLCSFILQKDKIISARANVMLFLACLVGLAGVIGTQTRATYLGLFICGFIAVLQWIRQRVFFRQNGTSIVKTLVFIAFFAALIAGLGKEIHYGRFSEAKSDIHTLLNKDLKDLPFTGVGIRVHSWVESLNWIAEKPITGWGLKARSDVIKLADHFPNDVKAQFGHLHNGYLELLLGFGVVGLAFLGILWGVLLKRIKLAASKDLYAFAFYASVFFLFLNMFESLFFYSHGLFAMSLFLAAGYSQYLKKSLVGLPPREQTETVDMGPQTTNKTTV